MKTNNKFDGVHKVTALVTLISSRVVVAAVRTRTGSFDEAIRQKLDANVTLQLFSFLLRYAVVLIQLFENVLRDPEISNEG